MQIMIFGFKLIHQFHHLHQKEYNHVLCPNLANPLDNAEIAKKINPQKCWGNADKKEKDLSKSKSYVLHSILLPKLMFMWPSGVIFIMISEGK